MVMMARGARATASRPRIVPKILKSADDVAPYVDVVRTSADRHRDELGFLRAGVYAEQAAQGHLWVAVEVGSDRLAGFLLYGGRFPHLRIFQLFVRKDARSHGDRKLPH